VSIQAVYKESNSKLSILAKEIDLATPTEIESMLWKEAEKRGIWKDTKLEYSMSSPSDTCYNKGLFTTEYIFSFDELWNKNGCIYKQGKFTKRDKRNNISFGKGVS